MKAQVLLRCPGWPTPAAVRWMTWHGQASGCTKQEVGPLLAVLCLELLSYVTTQQQTATPHMRNAVHGVPQCSLPRCAVTWCAMSYHAGQRTYLADAEQQVKAHFRQLDLESPGSWLPSLDNMGFAAGAYLYLYCTYSL